MHGKKIRGIREDLTYNLAASRLVRRVYKTRLLNVGDNELLARTALHKERQ